MLQPMRAHLLLSLLLPCPHIAVIAATLSTHLLLSLLLPCPHIAVIAATLSTHSGMGCCHCCYPVHTFGHGLLSLLLPCPHIRAWGWQAALTQQACLLAECIGAPCVRLVSFGGAPLPPPAHLRVFLPCGATHTQSANACLCARTRARSHMHAQAAAAASAGHIGQYGASVQCTQYHGPRVVLVGDAAHAMTGELRQVGRGGQGRGACCSLESCRRRSLCVHACVHARSCCACGGCRVQGWGFSASLQHPLHVQLERHCP